MFKIFWNGDKFEVEQGSIFDLEDLHWYALKEEANKIKIVEFLKRSGFDLIDYICYPDNQVSIVKTIEVCLPLEVNGTGFNILFHLLGYVLTNKSLEIVENSFKRSLHPNLWKVVKDALTTDNCIWLNPSNVRKYLKCTVNPSGDCGNCQHFETDNKQIVRFV